MRELDRSYFARRAEQELAASEKADNPKAADAHRALAEQFCKMIESEPLEESPDFRAA